MIYDVIVMFSKSDQSFLFKKGIHVYHYSASNILLIATTVKKKWIIDSAIIIISKFIRRDSLFESKSNQVRK